MCERHNFNLCYIATITSEDSLGEKSSTIDDDETRSNRAEGKAYAAHNKN